MMSKPSLQSPVMSGFFASRILRIGLVVVAVLFTISFFLIGLGFVLASRQHYSIFSYMYSIGEWFSFAGYLTAAVALGIASWTAFLDRSSLKVALWRSSATIATLVWAIGELLAFVARSPYGGDIVIAVGHALWACILGTAMAISFSKRERRDGVIWYETVFLLGTLALIISIFRDLLPLPTTGDYTPALVGQVLDAISLGIIGLAIALLGGLSSRVRRVLFIALCVLAIGYLGSAVSLPQLYGTSRSVNGVRIGFGLSFFVFASGAGIAVIAAAFLAKARIATAGLVRDQSTQPESSSQVHSQRGRFCSKCGTEQHLDASFCPQCGAHL